MKRIFMTLIPTLILAVAAYAAVDDATLQSIANGHAYQKHVVTNKEYPEITTKAQFFSLIKGVVGSPTATKNMPRSRTAYWGEAAKTIVIVDPASTDKGTAFRPTGGKAYFDAQTDIDDITN
jgi:filamentous hemagglutinin